MTRSLVASLILSAGLLLASSPSSPAELLGGATTPQCLPYTQALRIAGDKLHQVLLGGMGMLDPKHAIAMTMSPDGQTWTLFTIDTRGMACVLATGTWWMGPTIPGQRVGGSPSAE